MPPDTPTDMSGGADTGTPATDPAPLPGLSRAQVWRNVAVLTAAQAILGSQMSMQFISGGLVGTVLTPWACIATLPVSVIILGSALAARPLAGFMARHGRRTGFTLASVAGALGAAVSFAGLQAGSFWLFTLGTLITGIYMAAQGFYRFAAVDGAESGLHGKAISAVMAGGLVAGILGPYLAKVTGDAMGITYLGTYAAIIALNLLGPPLFALLSVPERPPAAAPSRPQTPVRLADLVRRPRILVAMICALVSYALMNLVMTSTPLAVVGCGLGREAVSDIVGAHVLAMFAPSFVTGHLIARFGATRIVATGLIILAAAGAVALSGVELGHFFAALILLGVGWNFGYIGATTMLTQAQRPEERESVQGLNDAVVFGGVFLASLASGGLLNCTGGSAQTGWNLVNLSMVPFLVLAGGALIWLVMRPKIEG